eukprot:11940025-Karenia_brevis.AAC.1
MQQQISGSPLLVRAEVASSKQRSNSSTSSSSSRKQSPASVDVNAAFRQQSKPRSLMNRSPRPSCAAMRNAMRRRAAARSASHSSLGSARSG